MADETHLAVLRQALGSGNIDVWNRWRAEDPERTPDLREAHLTGTDLRRADLRGADLEGARLHNADLRDADLAGASLREASFLRANLQGAGFVEADLRKADLRKACFHRADFQGASLTEADLRGADLSEAHLDKANLFGAALRGVDLRGATLRGAQLIGADLREADLREAALRGANLSRANLYGANLIEADLHEASLRRAGLHQVYLWETVFGDTDLREAEGLDVCIHYGPSTVDCRTLKRSWPLPLNFLRGCGLPDEYIEHVPKLVAEDAQDAPCFISYTSADRDFARRLHTDLQDHGVRCWFFPLDVQDSRRIHTQMSNGGPSANRVLLVLSEQSLGSEGVVEEIRRGFKRERSNKNGQMFFPVRLCADDVLHNWAPLAADEELAAGIRSQDIPDFSAWKDESAYRQTFERLLHAVRPG